MSTKLNEFQNASVGMTAGVIEVLCLQPFAYCKNMMQQGQPLSADPRKLYRGVGANAVSMGSCTMVQFAVGGSLKKLVLGGESRQLKMHEELGTGIAAGIVSALLATPLELVMIQQQRKGGGSIETVKSILHPNHFFRGFVGAAVREGLWTCGYLSIPPIVRRHLRESYPEKFDTDTKARVPAALLGGLFACYFTQPFDTVKTCMQGDIERKTYGTFIETTKKISESGLTAFYRGTTFRLGRTVCAVFLIDYLQGAIGPLLYPASFQEVLPIMST